MAERAERVEIGFAGGQVTAVRMDAKALSQLRDALNGGEGWHEIEGEDGNLALDLATVSFVRVERDDQSIGFAGG
ncbi:MAG: hypothetical protein ACR2N5_06310 [Solirubrobacterales bacterium]